ncbi:MAG: hypothetical protein RIC82_05975 [Parvibaculum sp.]
MRTTDITTAHAVLRVEEARRLLRSGRVAQALYLLDRAVMPMSETEAAKVLGRIDPDRRARSLKGGQ